VDNYDHKSQNEQTQTNLKKALDWEQSFVKFMHNYQKDNNVSHLFDLAFNSERSIEDELGHVHDYSISYFTPCSLNPKTNSKTMNPDFFSAFLTRQIIF
jgi:hypothetical protein